MRLALLLVIAVFAASCSSGPKIEGTYSNENGSIILELRSGGQAAFTFMGEVRACTYTVAQKQVSLDCKEPEKLVLTLHDDGSLTGPPGSLMGALRKRP